MPPPNPEVGSLAREPASSAWAVGAPEGVSAVHRDRQDDLGRPLGCFKDPRDSVSGSRWGAGGGTEVPPRALPRPAPNRKAASCSCRTVLRKEVIQPQVLLRLPCYDFTPVINTGLDACFPKVGATSSADVNFHGVTGGVYKARERIHRVMLLRDY